MKNFKIQGYLNLGMKLMIKIVILKNHLYDEVTTAASKRKMLWRISTSLFLQSLSLN